MFVRRSFDALGETETRPRPRPRPLGKGIRFAILVGLLFWAQPDFAVSMMARCKYSVRDVAFVNVHGKTWQLELVKPNDVDDERFEKWSASLRTKLERSNVGYIWLAPDSSRGLKMRAQVADSKSMLPAMTLSGPGEHIIPITKRISADSSLADELDRLLMSSGRREILDNLVDALCVVVLVESEDKEANRTARNETAAAIEQLERQMWTLEKPTDKGPALVIIKNRQVKNEEWLLQSLRIQESVLPAVAIVYGQGRRLGNVLVGNDLDAKKIMGRASICGQDCECSLNRDWLYGPQMIHLWSHDLERGAEQSLSFDPHSAFVIAEVAQIIQKNATGIAPNDRVDLGGGLVIHDLDDIGKPQKMNSGVLPATKAEKGATQNPNTLPSGDRKTQDSPVTIPWPLLLGLVLVALMIIGFLQRKQA